MPTILDDLWNAINIIGLSIGLTSLMIPLAAIMLFAPGGFVLSIAALILFVIVVLGGMGSVPFLP